MKRIKFYATITSFQKEKCVRLSALSELSFAGPDGLYSQLFMWHNRHGHEGGTIGTGCEGGGGTGRSELGTLSISASVFTVSGTSVSTEGVTLFSERSGTEHHGAGTIATLLGCGGHLVIYMGLVVLFWYRVNQNQLIYWTQGEGGCFFVLFQNH